LNFLERFNIDDARPAGDDKFEATRFFADFPLTDICLVGKKTMESRECEVVPIVSEVTSLGECQTGLAQISYF
jgi:hypothetical protein